MPRTRCAQTLLFAVVLAGCRQGGPQARCPVAADRPRAAADWVGVLDELDRADRFDPAVEAAGEALAAFPSDPMLIGRAARAYRRAGALRPARDVLTRLDTAANQPDHVAWLELLYMHVATGDEEPARAALRLLERACASDAEKSALLAGALDSMGVGVDDILGRGNDRITRTGRCPMERREDGRLAVSAFINDAGPYVLTLDTGGQAELTLPGHMADALGLKTTAQSTITNLLGEHAVRIAVAASVRIGDIELRNVPAQVMEAGTSRNADAILGFGLFVAHRVTFDNEKLEFVVAPSAPAAFWPWRQRAADFWWMDSKVVTPVTIDGAERAAILDTGATVTAGSDRLVRARPTTPVTLALGAHTDEVRTAETVTASASATLGGLNCHMEGVPALPFIDTQLSNIVGTYVDLLVGNDVLSLFPRWSIDYPQRKLIFTLPRKAQSGDR